MPYRPNFPIPENIHAPLCCLTIQVPDDPTWKSVVAGLLYELQYWFNWQRDEANSGKECAAVWKQIYLDIDWNLMACKNNDCCQEPAIIKRVNPDTGNVEQSTDGGATWTAAPGGFPSVIVQPVPPVTSGVAATKCDAATNVSGQVDVWINQVSNDFTTATTLLEFGLAVIGAIAAAVLTVLTDGVLLPLAAQVMAVLGAALAAVWGVGKTVFDDYWTTDIKDSILCAAYCNISDDGSFTAAQFTAFWNEVNGSLPPSPAKMLFMGFLSSVGQAGLNAMAASGMAADADCSDCPCASCADHMRLETTVFGGGEIIARTSDSVTVRTTDLGGRNQICIWTGNVDRGCSMIAFEVVEGAFSDFIDGIHVGTALAPGNISFHITTECCNTFITWVDGGAPFAIKFTFDGC